MTDSKLLPTLAPEPWAALHVARVLSRGEGEDRI